MLTGFRDFILRGKVGELAVAVLIGAAFSSLVSSLTKDIINPIIAAILGKQDLSALIINIYGAKIAYGSFLNAAISFVLVACVVYFVIVTPLGYLLAKIGVPPLPATRSCPECFSTVSELATRCAFCTVHIPTVINSFATYPQCYSHRSRRILHLIAN